MEYLATAKAEEVAPGIVRFDTPADFRPKVGNTPDGARYYP